MTTIEKMEEWLDSKEAQPVIDAMEGEKRRLYFTGLSALVHARVTVRDPQVQKVLHASVICAMYILAKSSINDMDSIRNI